MTTPGYHVQLSTEDLIERINGACCVITATITPTLATYILQHCSRPNRKMSKVALKVYQEEMRIGEWLLGVGMITFSDDGLLLNGYHRM